MTDPAAQPPADDENAARAAPPADASHANAAAAAAADIARLAPGLLYAPEQDMWVRPEADGSVTVGATHLVAAHGQFMLFTPRPPGTEVQRDRSLGVMETAKTAVAIHAPLSGRIVAVNDAAVQDVSLVERDPYGGGWLFRLKPSALEGEQSALLDIEAYAAWLLPRLADKQRVKPVADEFGEDLTVDPHLGY